MESLTALDVIDASIVKTALEFYAQSVTPVANNRLIRDMARLINQYRVIAETPLTHNDAGELIVAPADSGKQQRIVTIDKL